MSTGSFRVISSSLTTSIEVTISPSLNTSMPEYTSEAVYVLNVFNPSSSPAATKSSIGCDVPSAFGMNDSSKFSFFLK